MRTASIVLVLLAACGGDDGGTRPITFGGDRPVDLQVPATLTPGKKYPLLVVLHGYGTNSFVQSAVFGVTKIAEMDQALLLAPNGLVDSMGRQFWNADPVCCDNDHTNVDDVAYIGGLIDDVMAAWPVDPNQVFVIGHSNGGFMAYRMACERADVISAIGSLAGLASSTPTRCNPSRPVNVLHMHGTADTEVPFGPPAGADASVSQWAQKNGCGSTRMPGADLDLDSSQPGAETHRATIDGCPAGGAVELWTITGAGHIPNFGPSYTPTLLQWLTDHRRS